MADVTITDIRYEVTSGMGMWIADVTGIPHVNGVPSSKHAFSSEAVKTRMEAHNCTAQQAVASMVNEILSNMDDHLAARPQAVAAPLGPNAPIQQFYPGMTLPLPPLSASARQMISRIEDAIRRGDA